ELLQSRVITDRSEVKQLAVVGTKHSVRSTAQAYSLFDHRIEHWLEVAGRGVDDLQDLGSRGLLFQGFTRLGDQPGVLHRNDCLRREVLHQCDLFVGKWANFSTENREVTDENAVLAQRY